MWRLTVRLDTDAVGALEATRITKGILEPLYGHVGTITVAEWMVEDYESRPVPKLLRETP